MYFSAVAIRPLLLKPQWMNGLSERLLVSHYENNYGGALRRLNAIRARLAALDLSSTPVFEINGLKREELIAVGSVILHEIYFDSLGGHGDNPPTGLAEPPAGLAQALERDFGSVMAWRSEFTAIAKALAGGSGWAILAWSERLGRLVNHWAADHAHSLQGATPILALDMYEHAYHLDFGARAAAYVDQAMANLNWERIAARYRLAIGDGADDDELFLPYGAPAEAEARISAEELNAELEADDDRRPVLLDLCQPRDLPRRTDMLAGAAMHAPVALDRGAAARAADRGLLHLWLSSQRHRGRRNCGNGAMTPGPSSAGSPPGMRSVVRRCRSILPPTRRRHKNWRAILSCARHVSLSEDVFLRLTRRQNINRASGNREMARVISIHEYELRRDADGAAFERALRDADMRGLFNLTGLVEHHFLRGFKGARRGAYTAVWIFESREAWERLWGNLEAPRRPARYPRKWRVWENEVLAPFLGQHPDRIRFTSYEEL